MESRSNRDFIFHNMKISTSSMTGALARAFLQYSSTPLHSKHLEGQSVQFKITWAGNDMQNVDIGSIFIASADVLNTGESTRICRIDAPMQNGHGLVVRVMYPYPLPWHQTGNRSNRDFIPALAINDIARCLDLARSSTDTRRLLLANPDPSPAWQRLWRRHTIRAERRRIEKQERKVEEQRTRIRRDFP